MKISIVPVKIPNLSASVTVMRNSMAAAINRTLEEGQAAERASIAKNFVDRRNGLLNRMIKIGPEDRAKPASLVGSLRVVGPRGSEALAAILTRHESPASAQVAPAGQPFIIPSKAIRPTFATLVPRRLYPKKLGIVGTQGVSTKTFVVMNPNTAEPIGIYQRLGRGGGGTGKRGPRKQQNDRLLWSFHETVHLKRRLHFLEVVPKTIRDRIAINVRGMLDYFGRQ
jgi:hypothetical protein